MIRTNQTIIGSIDNPDEIVLSIFPDSYTRTKVNPQVSRKGQKSSAAQQRYNKKISNMHVVNLIINNFVSSDLFITLTYKDEPESLEIAEKEFDRFLNNLARFYRNRHVKCHYVGVTEQGEKGRYHHHFVLKQVSCISIQDIRERWSKRGIGALGHVQIDRIRKNEEDEQNDENDIAAVYLKAKYMTKNAISSTNKRFKHSEGLQEPLKTSSDDIFGRQDFKKLCENPDSNESVLMLIRKLCPHDNYELVDRRLIVNYIEGAGYYHVSARLRKLKKDSYVDFSMPDVYSFKYKKEEFTNNTKENIMSANKAIEAWINQKQERIPNLSKIIDIHWREYIEKNIAKYIKPNMTLQEAVSAIDMQIMSKNKFTVYLLRHIGKLMISNNTMPIELPKTTSRNYNQRDCNK